MGILFDLIAVALVALLLTWVFNPLDFLIRMILVSL
jgi:hypothetical protein